VGHLSTHFPVHFFFFTGIKMTDQAPKNNSIQDAIARAKAGAAGLAANAAGLPGQGDVAVIEAASTGVPGQYAPAQAVASLDGFLDAGVNLKPDFWLSTKNTGFSIKGHTIPIESLGNVGLALPDDMQAFYGLRININGAATYYKTADRIACLKTGRPWGQLIQEAASAGAREYRGFDIRLTALEDIKDMKGAVVVEAGKTLGYSTSITNFDDMAAFALKVRNQGLYGTDLVLTVRCDVRKNDKNKEGWGALVVDDFAPFTTEVAQAVADSQ
jgi:hypothetical protein